MNYIWLKLNCFISLGSKCSGNHWIQQKYVWLSFNSIKPSLFSVFLANRGIFYQQQTFQIWSVYNSSRQQERTRERLYWKCWYINELDLMVPPSPSVLCFQRQDNSTLLCRAVPSFSFLIRWRIWGETARKRSFLTYRLFCLPCPNFFTFLFYLLPSHQPA